MMFPETYPPVTRLSALPMSQKAQGCRKVRPRLFLFAAAKIRFNSFRLCFSAEVSEAHDAQPPGVSRTQASIAAAGPLPSPRRNVPIAPRYNLPAHRSGTGRLERSMLRNQYIAVLAGDRAAARFHRLPEPMATGMKRGTPAPKPLATFAGSRCGLRRVLSPQFRDNDLRSCRPPDFSLSGRRHGAFR